MPQLKRDLSQWAAISIVVYTGQAVYFLRCFCRVSGVPARQVILPTGEDFRTLVSSSKLAGQKYLWGPGMRHLKLTPKASLLTRE